MFSFSVPQPPIPADVVLIDPDDVDVPWSFLQPLWSAVWRSSVAALVFKIGLMLILAWSWGYTAEFRLWADVVPYLAFRMPEADFVNANSYSLLALAVVAFVVMFVMLLTYRRRPRRVTAGAASVSLFVLEVVLLEWVFDTFIREGVDLFYLALSGFLAALGAVVSWLWWRWEARDVRSEDFETLWVNQSIVASAES